MKDKLIDFIESHRVLTWIVIILVIVLLGACTLGGRKEEPPEEIPIEPQPVETLTPSPSPTSTPKPDYAPNLGLDNDDGRIVVPDPTPTPVPTPTPQVYPNFDTEVRIFDKTEVPERTMDGKSFKAYLKKVDLDDFGTKWGTELTEDDFFSGMKYFIGVEQEQGKEEIGNLQSVGWLHNNLGTLNPNDAVKFTNLHVIGSLHNRHVVVLCAYDWYSAYGLEDVLVVFEDISGTLSTDDFTEGNIFSAVVFAHNIKTVEVNGVRVLCVQYQVFE